MKRTGRLLPLGVVALLLALPAVGLAGDPLVGPKGMPPPSHVQKGVVPLDCIGLCGAVPGAMVATVGSADAVAYATVAGATVVGVPVAGPPITYSYYNSNGTDILASLRLPAGATIWRIDAYGYATVAGTQTWALLDEDPLNKDVLTLVGSAIDANGSTTGLLQTVLTFPTGVSVPPGDDWQLDLTPTSATNGYVGAVIQYTLPSLSLVPISPVRVFDSRFSRFGGPIKSGHPRLINVKDGINPGTGAVDAVGAIPQGARAIAYNLTVTGTVNAGYVDVLPGASTTVTGSSINWTGSNVTIANGGVVSLGSGANERQITIVLNGTSAQLIVDISGYYQ